MKRLLPICTLSFSLIICTCDSRHHSKEKALEQWRDQKFSMFIHWGLYSMLGGEWKGERVSKGYSEQIRAHGNIPKEEYAALAQEFNPVHWDADAVCELAKTAGMRSIIFTAKHHDGFCLFDTRYSDFDIVDATPYGRDILQELADACRRHGLKLGLYYSLIDWHFPDARPISSHNSDPIPARHEEYNAQQIEELVTRYGPLCELWFDMGAPTPEQSKRFAAIVHTHQPFCLVSSRVWNDQGDFIVTGDNFFPGFKMEVPWQSPASMFKDTWGYRSWQERGNAKDKVKEKIEALVRVVSRGGNYLLNIGPMGDGTIVPFEAEVLQSIGVWLRDNGEAIYAAQANPFDELDYGEATCKEGVIYLHVWQWPEDNLFKLPGLQNVIHQAHLLNDESQTLSAAAFENGWILQAPESITRDSLVTVIAVHYKGRLDILPPSIIKVDKNVIELTPKNAVEYYSFSQPEYYSMLRTTIKREWHLQSDENVVYRPVMRYTDQEIDRALHLKINDRDTVFTLDTTQPMVLQSSQAELQLDRLYRLGGFGRCSLGAIHGRTSGIEPIFTWSLSTIERWQGVPRWSSSSIFYGDDHEFTPTYFYQRIYTQKEMDYLVVIGSDDAAQVWLNGEQVLLKNQKNPNDLNRDVLNLSLKRGMNELLFKNYNRFGGAPLTYIDYRLPQIKYTKKLSPISLTAGELTTFTLTLSFPESMHEDLGLVNFAFWLEKK